MGKSGFTADQDKLLIELYPDTSNDEIAVLLGKKTRNIDSRASYLKLKKSHEYRSKVAGKIMLTEEISEFMKANYQSLSNRQIASALGLKLSITRGFLYQLGLKRMELEYWTQEQIDYLLETYEEKGNTELAKIFEERWPKKKRWTIKHIEKKLKRLGIKRSAYSVAELQKQWAADPRNKANILKHSASLNLTDRTVANYLSWRDKEKTELYLQMPDLINIKRQQLLLNRAIKQHGNNSQS